MDLYTAKNRSHGSLQFFCCALSSYLKEEIDHYTGNYAPSLSDKCVDSLNVDPLPTT